MLSIPLLVSSALLALHVQNPKGTFRQRDVKFFTELFANWIESAGKFDALRIHNNQIARELSQLSKKGAIKKSKKADQPHYQVSPYGLIICLQNILYVDISSNQHYLFFKIYFLSNYSDKIKDVLKSSESKIPTGLKLEIDPLLNWEKIVTEAITKAELDRERLKIRIKDALEMPMLVEKMIKFMPWSNIVNEIEKVFPYELNSMKPLSELCENLPEDIARWELTEGSRKRATQMWQPLLRILENYIQELKRTMKAI